MFVLRERHSGAWFNSTLPPGDNNMGKEDEAQVRSWGFDHVFTWTDGP